MPPGAERPLITEYGVGNTKPADAQWPVWDAALRRWRFRGPTVTTITSADSPYTASHGETVLVDTSSAMVIVNLPLVADGYPGDRVTVKKRTTDTNTVRIQRSGSDTFDGSTLLAIGSGGTRVWRSFEVPDAGSDWAIVGSG